jgi:O-antigen/teichoic acid export membrane protein
MSEGMRVGRGRAALDVAVQVAGRALNLLPGIVVTLLLARTLGDDGFGQWSTALAAVQIAAQVGDFGLEQVAVRRAATEREREHEWIGALLTLRLGIAVPVTLACVVAQLVLADNAQMAAAGMLLSGTLLIAPFSVTRATFQLRVRNDLSVLVLTVNSLLWMAAVVALWFGDSDSVAAFAAAFLGAAFISTALEVWLAFRMSRPAFRRSTRLWGELARIGVPIGIAGLLVTAYVKLDQILLFALAGADEAGLYGASYRILDQAQFVPIALMTTLFPIMASSWPADRARVRRLGQMIVDYLAIASLPALAFTIVASEPLVRLLFGTEFLEAAKALPILMGAFVTICFGYLAGNLVVILELQRLFLRNAALALVFNVVLNVILIPPYGFVAAAWVTLATEVLVTALTLRVALGRLELRLRLERILLTAGAAGVMALVVALLEGAGAPVGVLLAAAAVVYPVALLVFRALRPAEVRELLQLRRREKVEPDDAP